MEKKLFSTSLIFLLVGIITLTTASADITTDLKNFFTLDETTGNYIDSVATGQYLIPNASISRITGKVDKAVNMTANGQYLNQSNIIGINGANWTVCFWAYWATGGGTNPIIMNLAEYGASGGGLYIFANAAGTNMSIRWEEAGSVEKEASTGIGYIYKNNWYLYCVVRAGTKVQFYLNQTSVINVTDATFGNMGTMRKGTLGSYGSNWYNGGLDEVGFWNRSLNYTDIAYLYNSGIGIALFNSTTLTLHATNKYNGSSINEFNATLNNGSIDINLGTLNGTINTGILANSTSLWNITITKTDFFNNYTYNWNISESNGYTGELYQSIITPACYEKITNNTLTCINTTIYPNAATYNFSINVSGYYTRLTNNTLISALDNKTINITGFYSSNVSLRSNFTVGSGSLNCDYTISNDNYTEVVTSTTTNATIGLINGSYDGVVDCDDYAYSYNSFVVNSSSHNVTFNLFQSNSVDVYIYNQSTGALIIGINITLTFVSTSYQTTNMTSTGHGYVYNLTPDDYLVYAAGTGFETSSYYITVINKTTQNLSVYLVAASSPTVTFIVKDDDTGDLLEGVTFIVERWVNGTKVQVFSALTDVIGKVVHPYEASNSYYYTLSKSGYENKTFSLNTITSTSYTIQMSSLVSYNYDVDYANVLIYYTPKLFKNNYNYNISFTFSDEDNGLDYYGFNATFNGVTVESSGSAAGGSTLTKNITLNTSSLYDTLIISYWYKRTDGVRHDFTDKYNIYNGGGLTWAHNRENTYGMGWFERLLLATIIMMVIAGMMAWAGLGGTGIGIGVLIGLVLSNKIGLVPTSILWITIIPVIIILIWRASQ